MIRLACPALLLLLTPLTAQSVFRTTRHAALPPILVGDKFAAGDLDGDGDQDLVVANDNAPHQILINDGRGRFADATAARLVNPTQLAAHSVDVVDIDSDGDLDILFGHDDWFSNQVYQNNGAGFFTDVTATALPPNSEFTQNQVVADFDGDGDVDWFTVDSAVCHFYRNNGGGVFADVSTTQLQNLPTNLGERWQATARAADIDGDGDLDACVPTIGSSPFLIENLGGVLRPANALLPTVSGRNFMLVDIDVDGDADLVCSSPARLLRNQGNWTFVDNTATTLPGLTGASLHVIDADSDGDADLWNGNGIWWNGGAGVFTFQTAAGNYDPYNMGAAIADFDGDGDLDFAGRPNFLRQVAAIAAPVRGNTYAVDFHTRPGVTTPVLSLAALGAGNVAMPGLGTVLLDPASTVTIGVHVVGATPVTLSWQLPTNVAFSGVQLHYQAAMLDPVQGLLLSNAIGDVVQ